MKKQRSFFVGLFFTAAAFLLLIPTITDSTDLLAQEGIRAGNPAAPSAQLPQAAKARLVSSYGKLPLSFELNQGQTSEQVKFLSRGPGYALFLTNDDAVLALKGTAQEVGKKGQAAKSTVLRMKLAGANQSPKVAGLEELPGKSNYLIGKDSTKWRTNIPNYAKVRYQNVYPGIDLVYYGNQRQLEYDFVVGPGADPKAITLEIAGANGNALARLAENGDLVIKTEGGEVRFHKPVVYQVENSASTTANRKTVEGRFVLLAKNRIGFNVANFDRNQPLIIDPVLEYSTFLGGSNRYEQVRAIAVDSSANAYVTGYTESDDFPVTAGAFMPSGLPYSDVFVTKLSSDGASLVYSTYLGGSRLEQGLGIAVDSLGNAYVTGSTWSDDFPTVNPIQDTWGGGDCSSEPEGVLCNDAFVTKLNSTGSGLVYSTYLGGYGEDLGQSIALDASGNSYVAGRTQSSSFPTLNALQPSFGGGTCGIAPNANPCFDVFVAKIAGNGALAWSTYLGGSGDEAMRGVGIAVDAVGSVYVAGGTTSANFPVTAGAFQSTLKGPMDGFVSKINPAGTAFSYSTFLGGSSADECHDVAVDASGNAFLTGTAKSSDFPITEGAFDANCGTDGLCNGSRDGFVAKLNAAGSELIYSTYLGGSGADSPYTIAIDSMGLAYVTGFTDSPDFPDFPGQPFGGPHLGGTCANNQGTYPCPDAFFSKLSAGGEGLIVSGYLAGSGEDIGYGIALDSSRNAYLAGSTDSSDFPTTSGAFQATSPGVGDGFVVKLSDLATASVILSAESLDFGEQEVSTTSAAQTVTFRNVGDAAEIIPLLDVTGDFQFTHTCGTSIAPNTSCTADFTFTPQGVGTKTGEFRAFNGEEGQWFTILTLTGEGITSSVGLSPTSLTFASQAVGTASDPQHVILTNTGTAPLTINSIGTSLEFAQTSDCGASVPAESSCTISVSFRPSRIGDRSGQVSIASNAPGSPHSVSLIGIGYRPAPALPMLSTRSLSFGQVPAGQNRYLPVTLTNGGGSPLTMIRAGLLQGFPRFLIDNRCNPTLGPGNSCTIWVHFSPSGPGVYRGVLSIGYNAHGSPARVSLWARVPER
ncbi:MAG TPA: SBBP repeat-containing protein [Terriglobia bacterium]|nr:SBBP repeat-containing protein [Terriglobia bacterium]